MSKILSFSIGEKINGLEYLGEAGKQLQKNGEQKRLLNMRCFCGVIFSPRLNDLRSGKSNSCGCTKAEATRKTHTTHGMSDTKLFSVWNGIKSRCSNKKNKSYKDYGERGITMCDEWKNNFKLFYDWAVNNDYKDGLTIDRRDNDGNYEPSNCRWTTMGVQAMNTRILRATNTTGYRGVKFIKSRNAFCSVIGVNNKRIYLGYFKCPIEAAKTYDNYVIENGLEHTINGV
jgi:hypothetical protein